MAKKRKKKKIIKPNTKEWYKREIKKAQKKIKTRYDDLYLASKGKYKSIQHLSDFQMLKRYMPGKIALSALNKADLIDLLEQINDLLDTTEIKQIKSQINEWRENVGSRSMVGYIDQHMAELIKYRDYHQSFIFYDWGSEDARALMYESPAEALQTFKTALESDETNHEDEMREGNFIELSEMVTIDNVYDLSWELAQ